MALKRINLNLDTELLDKLDNYAKEMHVTRSAAISFLVHQYFTGFDMIMTMDKVINALEDIEKAKREPKK